MFVGAFLTGSTLDKLLISTGFFEFCPSYFGVNPSEIWKQGLEDFNGLSENHWFCLIAYSFVLFRPPKNKWFGCSTTHGWGLQKDTQVLLFLGGLLFLANFDRISYANHNTVEVNGGEFRLEPPNTTERWFRNAIDFCKFTSTGATLSCIKILKPSSCVIYTYYKYIPGDSKYPL